MVKPSDLLPPPPWEGPPIPKVLLGGNLTSTKVDLTEIEGNIHAQIPGERASADLSKMDPEMIAIFNLPPGKWYWFNRIINQSGKPRLGSLLLDEVLSYCKTKGYKILNQVNPYGALSQSELEKWYMSRGFVPLDYKKYKNSVLVFQTTNPAIPGFAFHNTRIETALQILKDGYLKPSLGALSFTLDPCFLVAYTGVTFVFPEQVIRDKYGGRELFPRGSQAWEQEEEVEVRSKIVYVSDCVEVLGGRDACWKYGYGYKYHYVDVRDRKDWVWTKFRR